MNVYMHKMEEKLQKKLETYGTKNVSKNVIRLSLLFINNCAEINKKMEWKPDLYKDLEEQ